MRSPNTFLKVYRFLGHIPGARQLHRISTRRRNLPQVRDFMGLDFPSPLGLGPGLDRNGDYYSVLSDFGFSHICIGPLTANPQENDLEAPNKGVRYAISRIQAQTPPTLLGIALTSNASSNGEGLTVKDFRTAFSLAYDFADFFILDFSPAYLKAMFDTGLVSSVADAILETRLTYDSYKPVAILLPSGIPSAMLEEIVSYSRLNGIDGICLLGKESIKQVSEAVSGRFPVIYSGPMDKGAEAAEILSAGAGLIQIRDDLVKGGGRLVSDIFKSIEQHK